VISRLQFTTEAGHRPPDAPHASSSPTAMPPSAEEPARVAPPKGNHEGSRPVPRSAVQDGPAKGAPHEGRPLKKVDFWFA